MWIVTKQFCEDPKAVGWSSSDCKHSDLSTLNTRFRLLCDDGEVCYEGVMDSDPARPMTWASDDGPFEPLLNFGMGRYGCNRVECLQNGVWVAF